MPRLSELADVLVACRVVTRERWDRAARAAGRDLARVLDAVAAEPPEWWDGTGDPPPGLTDYQRTMIEARVAAGELAALRRDLALNQFLLLDQIGHGGQGEVYRGRQLSPARFVAVKTLIRDTEIGRRRFEQEARALMKIGHPAVARFYLYERVRDAAGEPTNEYLMAMEHVAGTNLAKLVRRAGPVPWEFAARWAVELLGGLDLIHRSGFVHRDVKPDNVMVVGPDPAPGVDPGDTAVKLLDFGAVALSGGEGGGEGAVGTAPRFAGTREYAPPEQWAGESVPASDLYALGGTLYHALAGRPPYLKPNRDQAALLKAHTGEPIPDPRDRNPAVPPEVSRLVRRMMAKDAADRGTAAELIDEFSRLLRGTAAELPAPAAPPARPKPAPAPAAPETDDGSGSHNPVLSALERVFMPARLRPPPGSEPPTGERIAALLRRPPLLLTLAAIVVLLILWLK